MTSSFTALLNTGLFQSAQRANTMTTAGWILIAVAIVAMILLAWWVIRSAHNEKEPESAPVRLHPAEPPEVKAVEAPVTTAPDDLTIIEGIGPKIGSVLQTSGILTFSQLAALEPAQIKEILDKGGIRLADPSSWPEQARLAAAGDMDGLKALQDRLTAGRAS